MPSYDECAPNSSPVSRAINKILADGRFTALEMAEVCACSDRHIQNVAAGKAHLSDEKVAKLARWLCDHGEIRLSRAFIGSAFTLVRRASGQGNGTVKDEIMDLVHASAYLDDAEDDRNLDLFDKALAMLDQARADLVVERARLFPDAT